MPHRNVTWKDRWRYRFENTLSRGTVAIIGWLALVSLIIVVLAAVALALIGVASDPNDVAHSQLGFVEGAWQSLMHTLDAGNLAGDAGWTLRILMLLVTVGGIFIVSSLIGTITAGLDDRLTELRKGRSRVIEQDFTLILGWSSKIYSIIGELVIANANQKAPRIVILANRDKVEMDDDIRAKFPSTRNTRVICRSGDPLDLDDLAVVSPNAARAIVILAPEDDNPDIHVIKSVLALTNNPDRRKEPFHIVAEIRDEHNLEAGELVGGKEAIYVRGDELIARVTAQTCRQSGLSVVYTELLDFDGAEIYIKPEPALAGKPYRQVIDAYVESAVIGIIRADGETLVNPPMDTRFQAGDSVIAISEDDDTVVLSNDTLARPDATALVDRPKRIAKPERTLVLGWNPKAESIIRELDNYVAEGSEVVVMAKRDGVREKLLPLSKSIRRQRLRFAEGDVSSRAMLDALKVHTYDHIILLSYSDMPVQQADAQTLITLLHLRNIAEQEQVDLNIVSEMMDLRNRTLAQIARADDFIVSDKLVSLMISQLAENKALDKVLTILFSADGSEIYIRPIQDYIAIDHMVDFYTLIEAAARRGETAIGYRQMAFSDDAARGYGVKLNPKKTEKIRFGANDMIVVLAEE
ncbi:MAG: NAD-binding protein [Rhodanobacteraceae bacterium]|nr:NAD-binding protein [Rhodanobacteraceae bacterium]